MAESSERNPIDAAPPPRASSRFLRTALFLLSFAFAISPFSSPPIALGLGIALALLHLTAYEARGKALSRQLIQICVVLLGLRVDLHTVARAAADGVWLAIGTILGTLVLGALIGRALRIDREVTTLVSSGTAICGGSAIAAVGASIRAASSSIAVATGVVFILNAIALYAFPPLGHALHLTPQQFGTWCGVAIHDMSSVNGAAKQFAAGLDATDANLALDTANVVKLTRVLWIAPIALGAGWWFARAPQSAGSSTRAPNSSADSAKPRSKRAPIPWFIAFFIAASALRTFVPEIAQYQERIALVAGIGFQAALFLIGAGMSIAAIRRVGWRALVLAAVLWIAVASVSLVVIRA